MAILHLAALPPAGCGKRTIEYFCRDQRNKRTVRLFNVAANVLKTQAAQHAPNSLSIGYVIDKFGYNGQEMPTEHDYKFVVHYYPFAVSSSDGLPDGGTFVTYYELNWFS